MDHQISSLQTTIRMRSTALLETSCGYLLQELQMIWDEVGEDQFEREKVLLDLEQECLEVYRRKVDTANISRAHLHQELAEAEAEFTHLLLSLGERSLPGRPEKMTGTLKEQLDSITPALREMRLRKEERMNQFQAVQGQIQKISAEIAGQSEYDNSSSTVIVNENDLSLKKLEEYQIELQRLRNEKNERLQRVEKYIGKIHNLTAILGMDSSMIITKVHPSLNELSGMSKNISDSILAKLKSTVESLEEEKQKRLEKLRHLGRALKNLWNLMDTPSRERHSFCHVTDLLLVSSEVSDPGSLTPSIIQQAEAEVKRLDQLKASKMKELFHKKQNELEEICNKSHMEIPSQSEMDNITNLIKTGEIDHADLLMSMDEQISRAKEEASSRKAIMEKVEKWMLACDEERWLEEYNRDENRYSVSRGAHKNLRRVETLPIFLDHLVTAWGAILISVTLILLFGEIIPQSVCSRYGLAIGAAVAPVVRVLVFICFPVAYPISKLLDYLLGHGHVALFRRAELKTLVNMHGNEAGKGGELTHDETTIIAGALELTEKTASDAMTPISDTFAIDINAKLDRELMSLILEKGHSRVPVYYEQPTNIIGLILVKNLLTIHPEEEVPVKSVTIRRIPRVPETMPLYDILNEFQKGHSHMAVVVRRCKTTAEQTPSSPLENQVKAVKINVDVDMSSKERILKSKRSLQKWKSFSNSMNNSNKSGSRSKKWSKDIYSDILQIDGSPLPKQPEEEEAVGIITMEDLIEELLQEEIFDETDHHEEDL